VTGASRGVGRGVALVLGECGATVYVTGRSAQLEETAAEVSRRGGRAIAVRTDHRDDSQVESLFARVKAEQRVLDLLVANAWGGYEGSYQQAFSAPFWEQPLERWAAMVDGGLRAHFTAARQAAESVKSTASDAADTVKEEGRSAAYDVKDDLTSS